MKLTELQEIIAERLEKYGDGEVEISVEMKIHGQDMQIDSKLGELVPSIRYRGQEVSRVKYVLLNEGFE